MYQRFLSMSRAEIADRIRQQVQSRVDFIRYKAGAEFAPQMRPAGDSNPQFFFSPNAVSHLCARLSELFPETAQLIIERAGRICQHRFDLLGYESLNYGPRIDWHSDRVHEKRAPRKPWFRIHYLDFDEAGDNKVTWELNRHQHLVTLAKAFRLNGNPRFAQEIFLQWEHWHAENPYPIGINWASSLEVGLRSLSWIWIYFLLADSPVMPTNFRETWQRSLAISGRHIERNLSTYFSPNTHLLGEAVSLFFIGTLCPEIPSAERWQQRGWEIIQQQAKRQVRSDGFHFEQATYYHVYALDFFLHAALLASANGIPVPAELDRTMERMLDALAVLARGGGVPRLGDDDGGRVFDPARNRAAHLLDPLATGAVLFGRGDFKNLAGGLGEETLWLLGAPPPGYAGVEEFNRIPVVEPARESVALTDSGLYVMTSDDSGSQLVIDAGPQGAGSSGHGHADALSITATAAGRDLLIDSGTFEYVGGGFERDRFRGTRAHNTLMIDGLDQAEPTGPFAWENLPNVTAEVWIAGKAFDLFAGSHDGYARLPDPVIHRRFVFSLKSRFWLVRDVAMGSGEHQLDLFWHISPEFHEHAVQKDCFISGDESFRVVTVDCHAWTRNSEQHPHSPVYGRQDQHSALHFASRAVLPAEFVTLFVPSRNAEGLDRKPTLDHKLTGILGEPNSSVAGYRYEAGTQEHHIFFGNGERWSLNGWSSDAGFLYVTRAAQNDEAILIGCNATFVEWNGQKLMTTSCPVLRCEVIGQKPGVASSDPDAITVDVAAWKTFAASRIPEDDFKLT